MRRLVACLAVVSAATCAERQRIPPGSADALVARVVRAMGGAEAIANIRSLASYGHYVEPGYDLLIPARVLKMRPHFRVVGDAAARGRAEGFDGASWEFSRGKVVRSSGEADAATRRGAEFDYPFIDWKRKGHQIRLGEPRTFGGTDFEVLLVTLADGWALEYWIDPKSSLPTYSRKAMPLHAVGEPIEYLVSWSDWRDVGGVLTPHTMLERRLSNGALVSATIWDSVTVNPPLRPSDFAPPSPNQRGASTR